MMFCWIPGHVGLAGNDKADFAAKAALNSSQTLVCPLQLSDIRMHAKKTCVYSVHAHGKHYMTINVKNLLV